MTSFSLHFYNKLGLQRPGHQPPPLRCEPLEGAAAQDINIALLSSFFGPDVCVRVPDVSQSLYEGFLSKMCSSLEFCHHRDRSKRSRTGGARQTAVVQTFVPERHGRIEWNSVLNCFVTLSERHLLFPFAFCHEPGCYSSQDHDTPPPPWSPEGVKEVGCMIEPTSVLNST